MKTHPRNPERRPKNGTKARPEKPRGNESNAERGDNPIADKCTRPPPPMDSGIWRWENNIWVKKQTELRHWKFQKRTTGNKWVEVGLKEDADTPRGTPNLPPATQSGTAESILGQPRKDLPSGGVHLILFPRFKSWLGKKPTARNLWAALGDKRRVWFVSIAPAARLPDTPIGKRTFEYCNKLAPELTRTAWPLLSRWAKKITKEDYRSACGYSDKEAKLTQREADRRRKARKAHEDFEAATQPGGGKAI
jgi:hypothetical protein